MGKKIKFLNRYVNGPKGLAFVAGQEVEVTDPVYFYLRTDSPGSFEDVVETKAVKKPARNKAVRKPAKDK